jgi:hypothetical protein
LRRKHALRDAAITAADFLGGNSSSMQNACQAEATQSHMVYD